MVQLHHSRADKTSVVTTRVDHARSRQGQYWRQGAWRPRYSTSMIETSGHGRGCATDTTVGFAKPPQFLGMRSGILIAVCRSTIPSNGGYRRVGTMLNRRMSRLLLTWGVSALSSACVLAGCSSADESPLGGASAGAAGSTLIGHGGSGGMAGGHAGSAGSSPCAGAPIPCRGFDAEQCCNLDPGPLATCRDGNWMCGSSLAPGCNGTGCWQGLGGQSGGGAGGQAGQSAGGQAGDDRSAQGGEAGSASTTCSGDAPLCFGNSLQSCCGNDPAGIATCEAGSWICFGVPAPGCNGQSCI
jgi:hypothetical protein